MSYVIPFIYEDTHKGERSYDIWSRLLKDRIIFISGYLNVDMANAIIAQLLFLHAQDRDAEVQIYCNTTGGETMACLALYDMLMVSGLKVSTYCIGQCVGETNLILAAGQTGKRFMMPNARLTLRQPRGTAGGQASDIAIQAQYILDLRSRLYELLGMHTGQPAHKIFQDTQRDFILSPDMAKEYGLIDHILSLPLSPKE